MPCSVTYLVTSPFAQAAGLGVSASTVAMAAGIGLAGVAAYLAVRQLRNEYLDARQLFTWRHAAGRMFIEESNYQYSESVLAALELTDATLTSVNQHAARDFLLHQLQTTLDRLAHDPRPDGPELQARCRALLLIVLETPAEVNTLYAAYTQLTEEMTGNVQQEVVTKVTTALLQEIQYTRAEIQASPLTASFYDAIREDLFMQLASLEDLAASQARVAAQGLLLLRQRAHREIGIHFQHEKERTERAQAHRLLVNESLAKITAMQRQSLLPTYAERAEGLLVRLNELLTASPNVTEPLSELATRVNNLFAECEAELAQRAETDYIAAQLQETILALGLQVRAKSAATAATTQSVIAGLDMSRGLEFLFEAPGRIRVELVAFSEADKTVMPDAIESGFATANGIMDHLHERNCQVRERYRHLHKHPEGHALRVLPVKDIQIRSMAGMETPKLKEMRVEG